MVSGTCKGYAKPSWQSLVGVPADGVRDIPDVSLFAANGVWGHYYVYCYTDTKNGGVSCSGAPSTWSGAGGTSFASPIMAAMQSLVNQKTASSWGLTTPTYYNLAKAEYGTTGNSSCNSSNGNAASSSCTFYDVTAGDMDVNCTGTHNCYRPSGTNGVLSTSTTSYVKAYGTTTGWGLRHRHRHRQRLQPGLQLGDSKPLIPQPGETHRGSHQAPSLLLLYSLFTIHYSLLLRLRKINKCSYRIGMNQLHVHLVADVHTFAALHHAPFERRPDDAHIHALVA